VLAREGQLPYSLADGLTRLADLAAWTSARYPNVRAVRVGTAPYHHAGATATQDLAFSMATALEYLRAMTDAGLSLEEASRQLEFSFAVGCQTFLALAKLRAARLLFARVIQASGGSEEAARMRMFVRPSKRILTTRDPMVNILRSTACVFAAGLAQAQSIAAAPFDIMLGQPSTQARRIARNTHHILMMECHLHRVCDAAGGSWYVERLTNELARGAWTILQAIEARGGMGDCLASGWIASQIDQARQPRVHNLATRKDVVVGVSDFPLPLEKIERPTPPDRQALCAAALDRLARASSAADARTDTPTDRWLPHRDPGWRSDWSMNLARDGASIADIEGRLATPGQLPAMLPAAVHVHPYAEPFETLRDAADDFTRSFGHPPRVFLATLGTPAQRLARVNYCLNLFEAGGFEVLGAQGDGTPAGALQDFQSSAAHLAVICGPDEEYVLHLATLAPALHRAGARTVILAGNPGSQEQAYRAAGVDRFVFIKCDVVTLLRDLMQSEGVQIDQGGHP
jgi:methylmalonyl-CoA mutase